MLGKCWTNVERKVQMATTPFNVFESKGKVESILNESLNQFTRDSTGFQQAFNIFYIFNKLNDLFKRLRHLVQQSVESMLKQMLKPFKQAFTLQNYLCGIYRFLRRKCNIRIFIHEL